MRPSSRSARAAEEPVDSEVDLHVANQAAAPSSHRWVVPVIALGGMVGAGSRYGIESAWPPESGSVPWATLSINVTGCLLIGLLMVYVIDVARAHPLLRPFLGVGVLGGFTTFSTYAVETNTLLIDGQKGTGLFYLFATPVLALVAVAIGMLLARSGLRARRWLGRRRGVM
jgi:CrcB protein